MLRHVGKRARQPAQFVLAFERRFGRQVALGHLLDPFGQQQQGFGQLIAQHDRQQHGTEYRQKKTERQRADIHLAQAAARQGALLVLAVGLLHGNGVGHQTGGKHGGDLQKARLPQHAEIRVIDHGNGLDACCRGRARHRRADAGIDAQFAIATGDHFIKPFNLSDDLLAACIAQLLQRRPLGLDQIPRFAGIRNQLAGGAPKHHVAGPQLVAQTLNVQADDGIGDFR